MRIRIPLGYFYEKVIFYMSMILMKFSFVPQTVFRIFFFEDQDHDHDQDSTIKFNNKSYALNIKGTHKI